MTTKPVVTIIAFMAMVLFITLLLNVLMHQGDPWNKRLNELANDPIFATLPPDSYRIDPILKTPAKFRLPVFDTGGWYGASVKVKIVSEQPESMIYKFYADQAVAAGWKAVNKDSVGYWKKVYPDKTQANLVLYTLDNNTFSLGGSISVTGQ